MFVHCVPVLGISVSPDQVSIEVVGLFGGPVPAVPFVVHFDHPELFRVPTGPFKVVNKTPQEIPTHVTLVDVDS